MAAKRALRQRRGPQPTSSPYEIGCWYFPGWLDNAGWPASFTFPWARFRNALNGGIGDFPERIPLKGKTGLPYSQGGPLIEDPVLGAAYSGQTGTVVNGGYGGYPEGQQWVMDQQLMEMAAYIIKFTIFDHYWEGDAHAAANGRTAGSRMNHALNAYLASPYKSLVKFAVLCTNPLAYGWPDSWANWCALCDYYVSLFAQPTYLKTDGKPTVYIFDPNSLSVQSSARTVTNTTGGTLNYTFADSSTLTIPAGGSAYITYSHYLESAVQTDVSAGKITSVPLIDVGGGVSPSVNRMLTELRTRAIAQGYKGVHIVACQDNLAFWLAASPNQGAGAIQQMGFDGVTNYNYGFAWTSPYDGQLANKTNNAHTFYTPQTLPNQSLDQVYQTQWAYALSHSTLTFDVPISAGWDHRPWGASTDPLYDMCQPGSVDEFTKHLLNAKAFMDANPARTRRRGIVYAWNELGEGGFIEPTGKWGFQLLQAIKQVFG